jgi:hypothetical protein
MRWNYLCTVMPALVAGIHVFLAELSARKTWMAGTSPALMPNNSFDLTGTRLWEEERTTRILSNY